MAGEADLYEALDESITAAIKVLPLSGGDPDDPTTWTDEEREVLAALRADEAALAAHREPTHGMRAHGDLPRCLACGEDRPCTEARALRTRYGLSPAEYRGDL